MLVSDAASTPDKIARMTLTLHDEPRIRSQANAAGFTTVDQYVESLLDRDAERLAIREGIVDMEAGRTRPFREFDAEFRAKHGLKSA